MTKQQLKTKIDILEIELRRAQKTNRDLKAQNDFLLNQNAKLARKQLDGIIEKAPIGAATPDKAHNKEINHSIHQCCGKCKEEADAKGVNSTAHQCGAGRCK